MNTIRRTILSIAVAAGLAIPALAADRVTLKDGRVWEGEIVKETENLIQIKVMTGALETIQTIWIGDVEKVERDITIEGVKESDSARPASKPGATSSGKTSKADYSAPGVIVLPLKGGVGETFRHNEIERVAEYADTLVKEHNVRPIIVLEIESGGGAMGEMYAIHKTLMEVKKRHRVVAWIKEAISAAAATAFHCDEIYFTTVGSLGAMTGFNAATGQSLQGEMLQRWLRDASDWAEAGGRDGAIARAMIKHTYLLSYDVDEVTGDVTFHDTLNGKYVLSRENQNLVLNAETAMHCKFADGIANTKEDLAKLLDMPRWNEYSSYGYEISEAWHDLHELARTEIPRLLAEIAIIQSGPDRPEVKIGRTIRVYEQLLRWWDKAPDIVRYMLPPKDTIERIIKELKKQLADMRR